MHAAFLCSLHGAGQCLSLFRDTSQGTAMLATAPCRLHGAGLCLLPLCAASTRPGYSYHNFVLFPRGWTMLAMLRDASTGPGYAFRRSVLHPQGQAIAGATLYRLHGAGPCLPLLRAAYLGPVYACRFRATSNESIYNCCGSVPPPRGQAMATATRAAFTGPNIQTVALCHLHGARLWLLPLRAARMEPCFAATTPCHLPAVGLCLPLLRANSTVLGYVCRRSVSPLRGQTTAAAVPCRLHRPSYGCRHSCRLPGTGLCNRLSVPPLQGKAIPLASP